MLCLGPEPGCSLVRVKMGLFCILDGGDCDDGNAICLSLIQPIMKEDKCSCGYAKFPSNFT